MKTWVDLASLISNLKNYEDELLKGNLSETFVRDRVKELCDSHSLIFSRKLSDKKKLQKGYKESMDAINKIAKIKSEALVTLNEKIKELGYKGFVEKTGVSNETIVKIKRNGQAMRVDKLIELIKRVA